MTTAVANTLEVGSDGDAVFGILAEFLTSLGGLVQGGGAVADAVRIDRIAMLEKIKSALGAVEAAETVKLAQSQVNAQRAAGVDYRKLGRGIADQIALAVKVGPYEGSRRLTLARALWFDLPQTYELLARGQISEYVAQLVATETNHLAPNCGSRSTSNSWRQICIPWLRSRRPRVPGSWPTPPTPQVPCVGDAPHESNAG
jgi:hypothetical protein